MSWGSPVLAEKKFAVAAENFGDAEATDVMTVDGTLARSFALLVVLIGAALIPWTIFFRQYNPENAAAIPAIGGYLIGGMIAGLVLALIISFAPKTAPYLAVPYAFCEGVFLGGLSAYYEMQFPGLPMQAIAGTFGVAMVMFGLYSARIIRPTEKFRSVIIGATCGVALLYLVAFGLSLFGVQVGFLQNVIYGSGLLGIGFSVLVCGLAAMNLILDFGMIETGAQNRAPKYMSWFAAFGLIVTLVWLYLEILRLLAKLRGRD